VNFARSLAERSGQSIPDEALADAKKLSAWIDATQSKAPPAPPSEKQLALAERLAAQKGVELTSEQKKSGKACSAFIDKHMGGSNRPRGASREARA
jgi:DNA topoisomerase-3